VLHADYCTITKKCSTAHALLERKCSGSGLQTREYGRSHPSRSPRGTRYPQKLTITSPTSGGLSVGIVHSRRPEVCGMIMDIIHNPVFISNIQLFGDWTRRQNPVSKTLLQMKTGWWIMSRNTLFVLYTQFYSCNFLKIFFLLEACGSVVVKALCYEPEGRGFDTWWGELVNLSNPSGRTRP
jgi:hypothetical protein